MATAHVLVKLSKKSGSTSPVPDKNSVEFSFGPGPNNHASIKVEPNGDISVLAIPVKEEIRIEFELPPRLVWDSHTYSVAFTPKADGDARGVLLLAKANSVQAKKEWSLNDKDFDHFTIDGSKKERLWTAMKNDVKGTNYDYALIVTLIKPGSSPITIAHDPQIRNGGHDRINFTPLLIVVTVVIVVALVAALLAYLR